MSNNLSTYMSTRAAQKMQKKVPPPSAGQLRFQTGSEQMLDEARQLAENAIQQGQELNPIIYQMLGLQPQYEDNSADLQKAQGEMDTAQAQLTEAQKAMNTIKAIPIGRRSPAQQKQLNQLKRQIPQLQDALTTATGEHGRVSTLPKRITGVSRLDPSQIPANSPFSTQNPLNQAVSSETERLNQYLSGRGAVDPTLVHQYDQAEASLRAKLQQRFGPDYESSSVGQMALQNFSRTKNEAFTTWNQQQVERYNQLAMGGAAGLQSLLAGDIGLMREPSQTGLGEAANLANLTGPRFNEQSLSNQMLLGRAGLATTATQFNPATIAGGLGALAESPDVRAGVAGAAHGVASGYNALRSWMSNSGGTGAPNEADLNAAASNSATQYSPGAHEGYNVTEGGTDASGAAVGGGG